MKSIAIYIFCLLILLSASCKKNVLDTKPLDVLTEENVWKDFNLGRLYINEIYANLPGGIGRDIDATTEIEDGNQEGTRTYATGQVTSANSSLSSVWYNYAIIARINKFLEKFNPDGAPDADVIRLKGEAKFLRAVFYRELNDLFGGVPIITKVQNLNDDLLVKRNSYDECVSFIVQDLEDAAAVLGEPSEVEAGTANRGAALALKSRILLYAASPLHNPSNDILKWQAASDAALNVINGNFGYALFPEYRNLFLTDNNEEIIFDIQYQFPYRTTQNDYTLNPQGLNGAFGNSRPTQNMVDSYEMANGKPIKASGSGYDSKNPYVNRDQRFYASVLYNGATWRGITIETFHDGAFGPGENDTYSTAPHMTGYYHKKFLSEKNPIIFQDYRADENWVLIRYAEILLNYAETQIALGNSAEAIQYINMVRNRAGQPDLDGSLSGTALLERYRNERKVELAFEEHHYFDIRRWMIAPELHPGPVNRMDIVENNGAFEYTVEQMEDRVWRDAYYYLPIPQDEIDRNSNLAQNPGY
jgi:starch-binding outer membrane protein, SusD/RagB family